MTETNGRTGRIYFMDEVRGFDLLLMVAFHGFYTAGYLFGFRPAAWLFNFFNPVEPFFAGLFILICGISCRLSHSLSLIHIFGGGTGRLSGYSPGAEAAPRAIAAAISPAVSG